MKMNNLLRRTGFMFALLLSSVAVFSQNVHPTPQEMTVTGKQIKTPQSIRIIKDAKRNETYIAKLDALFGDKIQDKGYHVIIGVKGDKSVKAFSKNIPIQPEGYYLSINDKPSGIYMVELPGKRLCKRSFIDGARIWK